MMVPMIALMAVVTFAYLVIRAGATALEMTGISREAARFQATSAFFGAGFTTKESEMVVDHPMRRRVIRDLIVVGNIGVITFVSTAVITFIRAHEHDPRERAFTILIVFLAFVGMIFLVQTRAVSSALDNTIRWSLRRAGVTSTADYARLLGLRYGFSVSELHVTEQEWLADRTIGDLRLRAEGIIVLGVIRQDGTHIAAPNGETEIRVGDTLVLYGKSAGVAQLSERRKGPEGQAQHEQAAAETTRRRAEESEH